MEIKEIDLHGLSHDDAVSITENYLLLESSNSKGNGFEIKIITGNSPKLSIRIIQEVLDKYQFKWYTLPYNSGAIIVSENFL